VRFRYGVRVARTILSGAREGGARFLALATTPRAGKYGRFGGVRAGEGEGGDVEGSHIKIYVPGILTRDMRPAYVEHRTRALGKVIAPHRGLAARKTSGAGGGGGGGGGGGETRRSGVYLYGFEHGEG